MNRLHIPLEYMPRRRSAAHRILSSLGHLFMQSLILILGALAGWAILILLGGYG